MNGRFSSSDGKYAAVFFALFCVCITLFVCTMVEEKEKTVESAVHTAQQKCVVIDAGHGGEDGGAIGIDGVIEKNINLAISLKLRSYFEAAGYKVTMTRTKDISIYDSGSVTLREKKSSDIHNRYKILESNPKSAFLSIHQNKFEQQQYNGTQVFYSKNDPNSKVLAESIQKTVRSMLEPQNSRVVKPSGKNIYLLYHAKTPAVMVECGFLSNREEASMLQDPVYQQRIAFCIFCGALKYCPASDGGTNAEKS